MKWTAYLDGKWLGRVEADDQYAAFLEASALPGATGEGRLIVEPIIETMTAEQIERYQLELRAGLTRDGIDPDAMLRKLGL